MVRATKIKRKRKSVRSFARMLGVDHSHLSRVLRGERVSHRLLRDYRALLKEAA